MELNQIYLHFLNSFLFFCVFPPIPLGPLPPIPTHIPPIPPLSPPTPLLVGMGKWILEFVLVGIVVVGGIRMHAKTPEINVSPRARSQL